MKIHDVIQGEECCMMNMMPISQNYQKEHNISVVMRALLADDGCTRVKLSEITGLTQPAITKIIAQLMGWNAVYEMESIGSGVGRKAVRLHLNAERYCVAAVRVNRNYISAAIYDLSGARRATARCEISSAEGARGSMGQMIRLIRLLLRQNQLPVLGIGVAVPGPLHYQTGRISMMSGFPGWSEIDIKGELEEAFHLPTFVDHDANCGALAEMWHSSGREDDSDMLFICADRGIGAGLILNGSVYRGRNGFAGEFGHSSINIFGPRCECGNRGCLELYASTIALETLYCQEMFDPADPLAAGNTSAKEILELVRQKDPVACRIYSKTVAYLCFGVVGLINSLNPGTVVFSDKLVGDGKLFLQVANQVFRQHLMPEIYEKLSVRICTLDGDPVLLGASVLAFDHMLREPSAYFGVPEDENAGKDQEALLKKVEA